MNLLTDAVYWVAAGLALVTLVGGTWLTTRTPRRRRGFLPNLAVLLVASLLVTISVGLVLNRQNAWYPTLADLFPSAFDAAVKQYGAQPGEGRDSKVTRTDRRTLPALPSPGGRQQAVTVPTSVGHRQWNVTIILPDDYFDPAHATDAYPVLFAGHGVPGSMAQWYSTLDLRELGDPVVAAGKVHRFITIIPELTPGGVDTECVFGPDGPDQMETWLTKDIPEWVRTHLRAAPERDAWAWIGFSAGGWCSAMATMLHPDRFAAAVVLSGYFRPWWEGHTPAELDKAALERLDLVRLAETKPPAVSLWVQSSTADHLYHRDAVEFLAAVRPPTAVTEVTDTSGGHAMTSWRPHVGPALEWLGANVAGFRP